MSELKPCPFCGAEAELRFFNNGPSFSYRVECLNCTAMVGRRVAEYSTNRKFWFGTKREAISAWNTRVEHTCTLEPMEGWIGGSSRAVRCSVCGEMSDSAEFGMRFCPQCGEKAVG